MRRSPLSRGVSRKMFTRTAGNNNAHRKNFLHLMPMRGGIRL